MLKYRTDQMAHMDMHSIVDDLYERATEFMRVKVGECLGMPDAVYYRLLCGHLHYGEREISDA